MERTSARSRDLRSNTELAAEARPALPYPTRLRRHLGLVPSRPRPGTRTKPPTPGLRHAKNQTTRLRRLLVLVPSPLRPGTRTKRPTRGLRHVKNQTTRLRRLLVLVPSPLRPGTRTKRPTPGPRHVKNKKGGQRHGTGPRIVAAVLPALACPIQLIH